MRQPSVEYGAPATVAAAAVLLAEHQDQASVLADGQSLIPLLALRLARPAVLIDINGLQELSGVSASNGWVAVGAMTREYVAEDFKTIADGVPLLAAALPLIGHEAIRSRGTIGGSLAHADPAAELPAVARALVPRSWCVRSRVNASSRQRSGSRALAGPGRSRTTARMVALADMTCLPPTCRLIASGVHASHAIGTLQNRLQQVLSVGPVVAGEQHGRGEHPGRRCRPLTATAVRGRL